MVLQKLRAFSKRALKPGEGSGSAAPRGIRTTFFTAADRNYEMFVLPYIVSALTHNDDARVEVCLEDPGRFEEENSDAIAILREAFGERFLLRSGSFNVPANTVRFVEEPQVLTEYTYIGDIDILILEPITQQHVDNMVDIGLPYSNRTRSKGNYLTGLHFTRSDAYYPVKLPRDYQKFKTLDEQLLYRIIEHRGNGLPGEDATFRPVHGFHLSLRRLPAPRSGPGWGIGNKKHLRAYMGMSKSPLWKELLLCFDVNYRFLIMALEISLDHKHEEFESSFTPECLPISIFKDGDGWA